METESIIIPLEGKDNLTPAFRNVTASIDDLNSALAQTLKSEKLSAINAEARKLADSMSMAEKEAFLLAHSLEEGGKKATLSWTDFRSMYSTVLDAFRMGEQVFAATYGEFAKLTDTVRDFSLVSGQSSENASRFLEVLSDFGVTAQDATAAAKFLKNEGLSPNIDTLAMLADEFKKIQDPAERLAFIEQNLGRNGKEWVNVLNQESSALRERAASVNANLVVTEMDIKLREVQRLQMDDLKDKWADFTTGLGRNISMVIAYNTASNRAIEILKEQGVQTNYNTVNTDEYKVALEQAIAEQLAAADSSTEYTDTLKAQEEAAKAAAEQLKELSAANAETITGAIANTKATEDFTKSQDDLFQQIVDKTEELNSIPNWETEKLKETQEEYDKLTAKYDENKEAFIAAMEEKFAMMAVEKIAMEDGVAGYSDAEFAKAQAILETTNIATAAAFDQQHAQELLTDAVVNGRIGVEEFGSILDQVMADGVVSTNEVTAAINAIPPSKTVTVTVNTVQMGGYTGYGSGTSYGTSDTQYNQHAEGGMFTIPSAYGNEGFKMGGMDTASGDEKMKLIPEGKTGNEDVIAALEAMRIDETRLANTIVTALAMGRG